MSERITEAELRGIFDDANLENIDTTRPRWWDSATMLGLVAEVRRLRGLIVAADADPKRAVLDALTTRGPAVRALAAEACAIREEQDLT